MLKQIRQEKYSDMTYRRFIFLHERGELPWYQGYYTYLHRKYRPDLTYSAFVHRLTKYGLKNILLSN